MITQAYENSPSRPQQTQPIYEQPTTYEQPEDKYNVIAQTLSGTKYTLEADGEVKEIIDSISPELRNAFVILAIKNLKNDSLYGSFFKVKAPEEIQVELQEAESLVSSGSMMGQSNQVTQPSPGIPTPALETTALNDTFSNW